MQTVMNTSKTVFAFTKRATMKLKYLIVAERSPTKLNFRPKYVNNTKPKINSLIDDQIAKIELAIFFFDVLRCVMVMSRCMIFMSGCIV